MTRDAVIERVIAEVRPYTVVPDAGLATTIQLTLDAIAAGIPGDLVECGVWRGGASFAMLLAQRYAYGEIRRPIWMFDSFLGMSAPTPEDTEHAAAWYRQSKSGEPDPLDENWCVAQLADVIANVGHFGLADHVRIIPGWFHQTLPFYRPPQIAVLRIDADWYAPCSEIYRELAPLVSPGGPIIVDDYYAWEGCRYATHEYLAHNGDWPIAPVSDRCGVYMIKGKET